MPDVNDMELVRDFARTNPEAVFIHPSRTATRLRIGSFRRYRGGTIFAFTKEAWKLMAWTKTKTAVAAGVGILLLLGTAREAEKKHTETVQTVERQSHEGMTQMKLTGTTGAAVIGLYVQNGEIVVVSNSLPWSFSGTNISQLEFQTVKPADMIAVELVYDGNGAHAHMTEHLDAKFGRMEARVENGFIVTLHQK